jgi:molybdopterin synthase sulfur carrier subunit
MVEVHLWGALRPAVGGAPSVSVEAKNIRELFKKLGEDYPGFEPHLQRGIAVSINGRIYRDTWDQALPPDAEIYLLPRIPGG